MHAEGCYGRRPVRIGDRERAQAVDAQDRRERSARVQAQVRSGQDRVADDALVAEQLAQIRQAIGRRREMHDQIRYHGRRVRVQRAKHRNAGSTVGGAQRQEGDQSVIDCHRCVHVVERDVCVGGAGRAGVDGDERIEQRARQSDVQRGRTRKRLRLCKREGLAKVLKVAFAIDGELDLGLREVVDRSGRREVRVRDRRGKVPDEERIVDDVDVAVQVLDRSRHQRERHGDAGSFHRNAGVVVAAEQIGDAECVEASVQIRAAAAQHAGVPGRNKEIGQFAQWDPRGAGVVYGEPARYVHAAVHAERLARRGQKRAGQRVTRQVRAVDLAARLQFADAQQPAAGIGVGRVHLDRTVNNRKGKLERNPVGRRRQRRTRALRGRGQHVVISGRVARDRDQRAVDRYRFEAEAVGAPGQNVAQVVAHLDPARVQ